MARLMRFLAVGVKKSSSRAHPSSRFIRRRTNVAEVGPTEAFTPLRLLIHNVYYTLHRRVVRLLHVLAQVLASGTNRAFSPSAMAQAPCSSSK